MRPFGIFQHHSAAKLQKMKAEPLRKIFCLKEVELCRINEKKMRKDFSGFFSKFFLKSPVSRIVTKNVKEDFLKVLSVTKCLKNEGRTLWRY